MEKFTFEKYKELWLRLIRATALKYGPRENTFWVEPNFWRKWEAVIVRRYWWYYKDII